MSVAIWLLDLPRKVHSVTGFPVRATPLRNLARFPCSMSRSNRRVDPTLCPPPQGRRWSAFYQLRMKAQWCVTVLFIAKPLRFILVLGGRGGYVQTGYIADRRSETSLTH